MLERHSLKVQIRSAATLLMKLYAVVSLLFFFVVMTSIRLDIPLGNFTRDPAAIYGVNPFLGVISNIGILLWCSTAAICFFAAGLLLRVNKEKKIGQFLLFSGIFTTVLLLDDLFLLHESVFVQEFHVSEKITYLGYAIFLLYYFQRFWRVIFQTAYVILFMAFMFLGFSVICDVFLEQISMQLLVEDGLKLFGIATWMLYYVRTSFLQARERL